MHFSTTLFSAGLVSVALAAYTIQDDYSGDNFFSMFTFDTENDPTNGYVNFVDQNTAQASNLISTQNGVVTIRSDSTNVASGRGRNSVRITSTKQYTHGLVVLDLQHMPGSACGIWPAFWMTGPNWPSSGEIDIIEGVNLQSKDAITMHTSSGCTLNNANCQGNGGCGLQAGGSSSFGDGFNAAQGGVYAMQWTSDAINIWFFSRNSIPADVTGGSPDPSSWGAATASFQGGGGCDIDQHFMNNNIVFDTTFCGDWAGAVWGQDATCSAKASSCQDYVQNNPAAFGEAYWTINSLKVYADNGGNTDVAQVNAAVASSTAVAQATTTPVAAPSITTSVSSSPSPDDTPTANTPLTETEDGKIQWTKKRDNVSPFSSVVEQPAITRRDADVEVKRAVMGARHRHLRRHQLAGALSHSH